MARNALQYMALGHNRNQLSIPVVYLDLLDNDLQAALVLSQLVYWSDKATIEGGWIAKSYDEWFEEVRMSKYIVSRAIEKLVAAGIEHKVAKFAGNPTNHYRINVEKFTNWLEGLSVKNAENVSENFSLTTVKNFDYPLTEITYRDSIPPDTNKNLYLPPQAGANDFGGFSDYATSSEKPMGNVPPKTSLLVEKKTAPPQQANSNAVSEKGVKSGGAKKAKTKRTPKALVVREWDLLKFVDVKDWKAVERQWYYQENKMALTLMTAIWMNATKECYESHPEELDFLCDMYHEGKLPSNPMAYDFEQAGATHQVGAIEAHMEFIKAGLTLPDISIVTRNVRGKDGSDGGEVRYKAGYTLRAVIRFIPVFQEAMMKRARDMAEEDAEGDLS